MLQKRKRLNPALITCLGILINILGTTLLTQNHLKADAQTAIQVRTDQWLGSSGFMGISAANSSLNPFCVTVIALSYRQLLYQLYTIYHSNPEEPMVKS